MIDIDPIIGIDDILDENEIIDDVLVFLSFLYGFIQFYSFHLFN